MISLSLQEFNEAAQNWRVLVDPGPAALKRSVRLVTYNVWFSEYFQQERYQVLLNIVKNCRADVIGLQEVTPTCLEQILVQPWIRGHYYVSDTTGDTVEPHGVLFLSRLPIQRLWLHHLPSQKHRKLLVAEFRIGDQSVIVGNVHLESGETSAPIRAEQLKIVFPQLEDAEHAILLGDFNFDPSWTEENNRLDPDYEDVWTRLRGNEPGYTEDTDINLMRLEQKDDDVRKVRFDRILLRSSTWQPTCIQMLGTEPISPQQKNVFPSDHFGLAAEIEL